MSDYQETFWQQGVDSRALFATVVRKLPVLVGVAIAGAVVGSSFYLLIFFVKSQNVIYVSETEYYIEFAEGRYEARDYYNAFTWNDAIATDSILGRAMELLGEGYERSEVKTMITADILSDVRYLTITIKGDDAQEVGDVQKALEVALGAFGDEKREFDRIYKIEDLGICEEEVPFFTWRAAFLGTVIFFLTGLFWIVLQFGLGSAFYTKRDVSEALGVPVYGMVFAGKKDGKLGKFAIRQEKQLSDAMCTLKERYKSLYLLDASGGQKAEAFQQDLEKIAGADLPEFALYESLKQHDSEAFLVAVIPFGVHYREKIIDAMDNAQLHGGRVLGAVLVDVDKIWARIYY